LEQVRTDQHRQPYETGMHPVCQRNRQQHHDAGECGDAALYRERPLLGGSGRRCSAHRFTSLSTAAFPMVVILDISKLKSSNSDVTHATPDSDDGDSGKYLYEG